MMETLPIILYVLGAILLVVLIILGIKLIIVVNKTEDLIDNVTGKVNSLNSFFNIIDFTTNKLTNFSQKIVDVITSIVKKIVNKKEEDDDYE